MKKIFYIVPAIALVLLSSCYDGTYVERERILTGELETKPARITSESITLQGSGERPDMGNVYFQLGRSKDFSNSMIIPVESAGNYFKSNKFELEKFGGTYYYRAFLELNRDTIYAQNFETFTVDNTLTISNLEALDATSYRISCTTNLYARVLFKVSTDQYFSDYRVCEASLSGGNNSNYEYSSIIENLSSNTTYYVQAYRNVYLGPVESGVVTFTTADFLKMGEVTYTGWDGKTYPMTEGYDHFFANYAINGQVTDRNLEIYRTENGWTLSKDITPTGNGLLYGFYTYVMQNSDNAIEIQTYKYDNPTLMWGVAEEDKGGFNINLRNMLARVVFHLTVSDDYPVDKPEVGEFTISGNTLPTIASFQVNTGTFTYNQWSFSEPLGYWNRIGLCKGETVDLVLYSIPSSDPGKGTVSMNFINDNFDSEIEIDWRSGNTYEYNLNVTAAGLSISDVIVNEWQPTDGGSIIINPNK